MKLTYLASIIFVTNLVSFNPVHPEPVEGCTEKPPLTRLEDFCSDAASNSSAHPELVEGDLDNLDVMAAAIEDVDLDLQPPAWYFMWLQKVAVKLKLLSLYLTLHAWYTNARELVNTTFFGLPHEQQQT